MTPRLKLLTCDDAPEANTRPVALVAEPDRLRGALIVAGLDDLGIDVVWVADGERARESAEERSFDIHVADPSLRTTRGECVVRALVTEHPRVPLVVTAFSAALIHLVSARIPVAHVVGRVRSALGQGHELRVTGTAPAR